MDNEIIRVKSKCSDILDAIDTAAEPPKDEPQRQYYFMAKCREIIKERELETGRRQTANVTTFGCQMNV